MSHDNDPTSPELRSEALEDLLVEKGILDRSRIDSLIQRFENDIGPMIGAQVVARAWTDPDFRELLLNDADTAIETLDVDSIQMEHLEVKDNSTTEHHVVVCTLCSCYPWGLLGLPPNWYKSPEYRARIVREPRQVLSEMGLEVPASKHVSLWDSSSETRFLVLPEQPPGTEQLSVEELAQLVTRDSMIGVGLPSQASQAGQAP